jgi:phytoene synthase
MDEGFQHCERVVRAADKDRFLATLFAPAEFRGPLFALYAFNCEIAQVRDLAREPLPGEMRLQWWHEALAGERRAEAMANPTAAALFAAIDRHRLPIQAFIDLVEARSFDLYDDPMMTVAELESYAAKTSSVLFDLAAQILRGGADPVVGGLSRHAGITYAIARLLQAFPRHAARRQLFVPVEVLDRHGARAEDIFAGRTTVELRAALAELRLRARRHLAAADDVVAKAPAAVLPAFLPVALVGPLLARMEQRGDEPFAPLEIPQWRRQWILWRAARKPRAVAR